MKRLSLPLPLFLASLLLSWAGASAAEGEADRHPSVSRRALIGHHSPFLINRVFNGYRNDGIGSQHPVAGPGFEFPKSTDSTARYTSEMLLYSDGLVWGGFHRGELRVGGSSYSSTLQPGRISVAGSAGNPPAAVQPGLASARVYRVRRDITPQTLPDTAIAIVRAEELWLIDRYDEATAQQICDQYLADWREWPASEGAPFEDLNGNGLYDWNADVPGMPGADQTLWYVANDCDSARVANGMGSRTIGLEMQRTIWGYRNAGWLDNVIFLQTRLINKSGARIDSMFLAQWADPDLGDAYDDYVGCDTVCQVGYAYNALDYDPVYHVRTPAFGAVLLQGPSVASPGDTAIMLGRRRPGFRNLPLFAFPVLLKSHSIYGDPILTSPEQWYRDLNGVAARTGSAYVDPVTGRTTKICFPGDPVAGQGWIDGGKFPPGDRRLMMSCGPFAMADGDTQEIVLAHAGAQGEDRLASLQILRSYAGAARILHQNLFAGIPPGVTVAVGHPSSAEASVTVTADCRRESFAAISALLDSPGSGTIAEIPLYDDGTHGDAGIADGIFSGGSVISRQPSPLIVRIKGSGGGGQPVVRDPLIDPITTAGRVLLDAPSVFSDNFNSDGHLAPGESIRYGVTVLNQTPFTLAGVTLQQLTEKGESPTIRLEQVPAGGQRVLQYNPSDATSYLSVSVTPYKPPPVLPLPISIRDAAGNIWRDTVSFLVEPAPFAVRRDTLVHVQGPGTGNFELLIVDPVQFTGHTYSVRGVDSINANGDPGITLIDATTGTTLLANHPLPDSLGHAMPVTDGFRLQRGSTVPTSGRMTGYETQGYPNWTPLDVSGVLALEGFNGTIGNATDHWVSGGAGYRRQHSVLIKFAPTDTLGTILRGTRYDTLASFAYRYVLNADQPPADPAFVPFLINRSGKFAYQEYELSLPMAAYDLESTPVRRLMVGHLENNVPGGELNGRYWPPLFSKADNGTWTGPSEWFFVFDVPYATTPDPSLAVDISAVRVPLMWVGYPARARAGAFSPRQPEGVYRIDEFRIWASQAPGSGDEWAITLKREEFLPATYTLSQNYPNPFNPTTTIRFALAYPGSVTLAVYNILGQKVRTLVNENRYAGEFSVAWDGVNDAGLPVSSGVYFYRLDARPAGGTGEPGLLVKKMMIIR